MHSLLSNKISNIIAVIMSFIRSKLIIISLLSVLITVNCGKSEKKNKENSNAIDASIENVELKEAEEQPLVDAYGYLEDEYDVIEGKVKKNESFYIILRAHDISPQMIHELDNASKDVFRMNRIQQNQKYYLYKNAETDELVRMIYHKNALEYVVFDWEDDIEITDGSKELYKEVAAAKGTVKSSLYNALVAQNVNILIANKLSEIFGWQVDFFRIHKGDKFKVIYEKQFIEGKPYGIGEVIAAEFTHQNETYTAFLYDNGEKEGYFDKNGKSVQKALLKAPFTYSHRISSGFSHNRFHPVLGENRPHYGVDYAAPLGTPVLAVGDGEVLEAQYRGANGNIVKIRHNSTYTTAYLHLNGFAKGVRKGARVKQGQTIGYVGKTGRVTGVHLDYRVYKNGTPVNPLTLVLPPAEGISDEDMNEYQNFIRDLKKQLENIPAEGEVLVSN